MSKTTKDKIITVLKYIYTIVIAANGVAAYSNPISASIAGIGIIASAISALIKDKNLGPLANTINVIGVNLIKAKNDKEVNNN